MPSSILNRLKKSISQLKDNRKKSQAKLKRQQAALRKFNKDKALDKRTVRLTKAQKGKR